MSGNDGRGVRASDRAPDGHPGGKPNRALAVGGEGDARAGGVRVREARAARAVGSRVRTRATLPSMPDMTPAR